MSNFDRRRFLAGGLKGAATLGVIGVGGTLLEACGSSGGTSPSTTLKKSTAEQIGVTPSSVKPKKGGKLAFGTEAEEAGLDPTYAHFDSTGVMYARAVYDPLAMLDFNGNVVPYLAESITPSSDYRTWTITVRPNIMFHDGTPCDGSALQFCMQEFLKSGLTNFAFTNYMDISNPQKAVTKVGPRSIEMHMEQPWVPFDYWLAGYIGGQMAYMFSPKAYLKGESTFNTHPVGTGPFVFQQWNVNQNITFTANPHYWRKDKWGQTLPYLDTMEYVPQPDADTRLSELQSGSIQMMHTDYDPVIVSVLGDKSLDALGDNSLSVGEPDVTFAMINVADPVMKDPLIRQALAYATNQAAISKDLGKGITHPTNGPFPAPSPYASDTGYPEFNLEKAKSYYHRFLQNHGGTQPNITYTTTSSPQSLADASYLQQMWKQAGINVAVNQVQQSKLINDALAGGFQIFAWRQFASVNPDLNYVFWANTSGPINFARNNDPQIQHALDTARQSTDPTTQKQAYQTIAKRFAVDLPYIYTGRDVWYVAAQKQVQNWNNPTTPDGKRGLTILSGIIWPTEIWIKS